MTWPDRLLRIDNRWLYTALALFVAAPVFVPMRPAIPASPETLGIYRAVEAVPPGKTVMVLSTWDAGTIGECEGQTNGVIEHLMRRGIPFVIWTSNPASPPFYNRVVQAAARRHGRVYGRDWVDCGYKVPADQLKYAIQMLSRDFRGYMRVDAHGTPIDQLPLTSSIKGAADFDLLLSIGYNPTVEFIQFVQGVYGTKVGFGVAAINSTVCYSYIDSKQIVGMLVGARGGAEYETLVKRPGKGVDIIVAQSYGHLLIILAVVAANVAVLAKRRAARSEAL